MRLGNVLLSTFYQTLGQTPSEVRIVCNNTDSAIVASRLSSLLHQMWMNKVVLTGKQVSFPSLHEEQDYAILNGDPFSCILGYHSVSVKVDALVIQSLDGWALTCYDDILQDALATLSHEYLIEFDGYVSYRWLSADGEVFTEFELSSSDKFLNDRVFGWVGSLIGELLKHMDCYDVLRKRLAGANGVDREEFKIALNAYKSWIAPITYAEVIALV